MFKLLVLLLQIVGLSLLGAGPVWYYDHHPAWDFTVPAPVRWVLPASWKHIVLGSLASDRDKALAAAQTAQDATKTCRASLDSQNAAISLLARESAAKLAAANHDIEAARAVAESHRQASIVLRSYVPKGDDELARWRDADRAVGEALK